MKLYVNYDVSRETYYNLARIAHRSRFHLTGLMMFGACLFFVSECLRIYSGDEQNASTYLSLALLVIGAVLQLLNETLIPKMQYRALEENGLVKNVMTITDEYLQFGEGIHSESHLWNEFQKCMETSEAFLLIKSTSFEIILKEAIGDHEDEVRTFLIKNVNKGRPHKKKRR